MSISKIEMSRGRQTLRILMFSLHLAPSKMDFLNIPSVLKTTASPSGLASGWQNARFKKAYKSLGILIILAFRRVDFLNLA